MDFGFALLATEPLASRSPPLALPTTALGSSIDGVGTLSLTTGRRTSRLSSSSSTTSHRSKQIVRTKLGADRRLEGSVCLH